MANKKKKTLNNVEVKNVSLALCTGLTQRVVVRTQLKSQYFHVAHSPFKITSIIFSK